MAKSKISCALYYPSNSNLRETLNFIYNCPWYQFAVVPMFHPGLIREEVQHNSDRPLSRSCRILDGTEWQTYLVGAVSKHIDADSPDPAVRKRSEKLLRQELDYAAHISFSAILIYLNSRNCVNFARIILSYLQQQIHAEIWVQIPLENPQIAQDMHRSDVRADREHESTWEWWNVFRTLCDSHPRLGVVLDVGADLPAESDRIRWMGEPVRSLFVRTSTFLTNKRGHPVLAVAHHRFLRNFSGFVNNVIIAGPNRHHSISSYGNYISYIWNLTKSPEDGYDEDSQYSDSLQCPLQPLMNNLEASTYEVFERDPVKYKVYRQAIHQALLDRVPEEKKDDVVTVIMVMGAGRGPLVQAALEAADEAVRKVRVYAVEKNPNAVITLRCRRDEEWEDRVQVIAGDMRRLELTEKADILVSELLGSFSDNELSPECLDGAQIYLKDDGISIPRDYTSYVCPVMSQKLYVEARASGVEPGKPPSASLETFYVVLQRNKLFLDKPVPLFKFEHPNRDEVIDNSRYESRTFSHPRKCVLHGFSGFFHTTLYKDICLSIVPETFSTGMFSWFPIYMPLMRPVMVEAGIDITAHFWRCVGEKDVWYEWTISSPEPLPMQNVNGRSSKMGL